MISARFALRNLLRDFRAGELTVLLIAIVVAVTSMTAVGFFTDRVARAVQAQAAETLAADLVIRSPAPIDERFLLQAQQAGLQTSQAFGFPTVAIGKDDSRTLSVVNAVSAGYPLRGKVLISDSMFAGSYEATAVPEPGAAWAEPGLMARLGLDIGDTVKLGSAEFRLTKEYCGCPVDAGCAHRQPGNLSATICWHCRSYRGVPKQRQGRTVG
jgi:putative ABC transport system permease protein